MKDKNPHIEELTSKVIIQEFTTCSLKAVRLADRINEWHHEKVKELEKELQKYKDLYYKETTRADLLQEKNDAIEFAEWTYINNWVFYSTKQEWYIELRHGGVDLSTGKTTQELYQQFLTSKTK